MADDHIDSVVTRVAHGLVGSVVPASPDDRLTQPRQCRLACAILSIAVLAGYGALTPIEVLAHPESRWYGYW